MSTTLILGAGVMGTAFAFPLADAGGRVLLAGTHLDDEPVEEMKAGRPHPRLGMAVPAGVEPFFSHELSSAIVGTADLVVLGVSSPGVGWAVERLAESLDHAVPVLLLTKGLAVNDNRIQTLPGLVATALAAKAGWQAGSVVAGGVGGPCIAGELAARRDTTVVFGTPERMKPLLAGRVGARYYHVSYSTDVVGVEACAALKNFLAIGVATAAGALAPPADNGAASNNPEAALFSQAVSELSYLTAALGGRAVTAAGPAGVGDLYVTCRAGRNSRLGRLLGGGLTVGEARLQLAGETVEGADLALAVGPTLRQMMACGELDEDRIPLTRSILASVCDGELFSFSF